MEAILQFNKSQLETFKAQLKSQFPQHSSLIDSMASNTLAYAYSQHIADTTGIKSGAHVTTAAIHKTIGTISQVAQSILFGQK